MYNIIELVASASLFLRLSESYLNLGMKYVSLNITQPMFHTKFKNFVTCAVI